MYIENTLKRFNLHNANNTPTPLPAGIHLEKSEGTASHETKTYYQQIIQTLIYATIDTRPSIAFTAMRLSWYNNNPPEEHLMYAKYVMKYLKNSRWEFWCQINWILGFGLGQKQRWLSLYIMTCFPDGKWCYTLGITMAKDCSTSVGEAEYMELTSTGWQVAWLRSLSKEIGKDWYHHVQTIRPQYSSP